MRAIIGGYRGTSYVQRALESLNDNGDGLDELIIVDDSGQPTWAEQMRWLKFRTADGGFSHPHVIELARRGYNVAMQTVLRHAPHDAPFLFWEEDFTLDVPTSFRELQVILEHSPDLAQVALLRGPHFPIEHEQGGLLEGLVARLGADRVGLKRENRTLLSNADGTMTLTTDLITQRGTFTCNPSVWAPIVKQLGWPRGNWSEDKMRDRLLARGYQFAFIDGVRVTHDGVRSGHGY